MRSPGQKHLFSLLLLSIAAIVLQIIPATLQESNSTISISTTPAEFNDRGTSSPPITLQSRNSNKLIFPDRKESTDILFMVMGQRKYFLSWHSLLKDIDANIFFVYASFDGAVNSTDEKSCNCHRNNTDLQCETIFIPGTTWTEGRNLLAEEAIREERRRGKQFTHWVFADEGVVPDCWTTKDIISKVYGRAGYGAKSCWQRIFDYIGSSIVPENASSISMPLNKARPMQFQATSNADALFFAFKRDYVPYLLPYPSLRKGTSEWLSQAGLFCVINTCMKQSVAYVPYITVKNPMHRPYTRVGLDAKNLTQVVRNNYFNEDLGFTPCAGFDSLGQNYDLTAPLSPENAHTLNNLIPTQKLSSCEALKLRHESWEAAIASIKEY
mmetsp:Transcript_51748/g.155306  ORF Transcript_51748/g.155306 Transcript_51748/m.155306 type:complete len:383 (-) Transcript_51748:216-1364(-)